MVKFFMAMTFILITMIGSVFGVLFTKPGNNLIASYIEDIVNSENKEANFKVENFQLTFDSVNFDATIAKSSNININGDLKIFSKTVDLKYDIDVKDLSTLEPLINQRLNGPLKTKGTFKGDENFSVINGTSTLASSDTSYNLELKNYEPSNINLSIKNANISELLYLVNQAKYAKGVLNLNANIKNAKLPTLDGNIVSSIIDGKINNDIVNKSFNLALKDEITFKSRTNAILTPNKITAKATLINSLSTISSDETVVLLDKNQVKSNYKIDIANLSKLEQIIGIKLNDKFSTHGVVEVNNGVIDIKGRSDVFDSFTNYETKIENAKPSFLYLNIKDAKLDKLLYLLNQPKYSTGNLDLIADIKNADINNLAGLVTTQIKDAKLVNKVINKQFNQKLKQAVTYKVDTKTNLEKTNAITNGNVDSSLAKLDIKNAIFNIKEASLNSNYVLNVPSLSKLYDVTQTKMRGKLALNGKLESKKESLLVTGASKLLGGNLDFKLNNNDFTANVKGVEIKELTHMMYYPEVFDSTSNLALNYNLLLKKGKLTGSLIKGHFLANDFSVLINQFAKFDLTREIYDTVDINSDINNMVLKTIVNMKSKNTQIDVTKSLLDLNKSYVNADIKAKIRKLNLDFNVKGNMKSPKVKLNTKGLLKNKIEEKINDKLGDKLKEKLGDEGAKELLNNFKSLF
ncbi:hypothetical protein [Arcobacter roscoffensis]|uniref:Outer membrane protein n=1 Tax=Arcobacter roscoffensis TaxID=2961520 RepID=A0ABY5E4X4_9BACT|nr:hypothetical protein [Arcobacter roscoffensis]UTJ07216.1 hypothetical protein NJU99_03765 [Arcobacter roscoffensis]